MLSPRPVELSRCLCLILAAAASVSPLQAQAAAADDESTRLDAVVVTATATERPVQTAPASISVIRGEELRQRPAADPLDAIRDVPGLNVTSAGSYGRRVISIRGMESRHTLILVDGERVTPTDQVFGLSDLEFGWIPMEAIERIEVVRGPLSSLYGSDALGGVVNIITRSDAEHWRGNVRTTYGYLPEDEGGAFREVGAYLSGPLGRAFSLAVGGSWQHQDAVPDPDLTGLTQREDTTRRNLRTRLQWQISDQHRLALTLMGGDEDRWYYTRGRSPVIYRQSYDFDRRHAGLSYEGQVADGQLSLRGYTASIRQVQTNTHGVAPSPRQKAAEESFDGHYSRDLGESHRITGGFELRNEKLRHPSFASGQDDMRHRALFLQDEWSLSEQFDLVYGVRWDKHELFGSELSPRLYAVWALSPEWTLKGGYAHGFKAPMLKWISPDYRFDGPHSFIGNADLAPEKNDNVELSLAWDGDNQWASATVYHNKVKDLINVVCIDFCTRPLGNLLHYENVSDARIRGVETELGALLPAGFRVDANWSYSDAQDRQRNTRLYGRPLQNGNVRLDWLSPSQDWRLGLRYAYFGRQRISQLHKQPSYGTWNLSARWQFSDKASALLGIENLTDHRVDERNHYNYLERGRYVYAMLDLGF